MKGTLGRLGRDRPALFEVLDPALSQQPAAGPTGAPDRRAELDPAAGGAGSPGGPADLAAPAPAIRPRPAGLDLAP